jgi:drug/metabolite transporter (DMT)-like permease
VPALVVLMSWLVLGEVPGVLTLGGGALCLAGVAVSRSRARGGRTSRVAAGRKPRPEKVG